MTLVSPPVFQIHWSLVPPGDAAELAPPGCRLLAIWPVPVNHDACFEAAGFTLFGVNDDDWDRAAEDLLRQVIEQLSRFGSSKLVCEPLKDHVPWYLRPFRTGEELPFLQQALLPMLDDSLPGFHALFGGKGAALRTGDGHFLLWVTLPDTGGDPVAFVEHVAGPYEIIETPLRWINLLPSPSCAVTG